MYKTRRRLGTTSYVSIISRPPIKRVLNTFGPTRHLSSSDMILRNHTGRKWIKYTTSHVPRRLVSTRQTRSKHYELVLRERSTCWVSARRTGATLLLASTSEIYGDPLESPQRESYFGHVNPIGPRSCYDEGKRVAETLCRDYAHQYATDVRIARIFNTYGPGMLPNDGRVITTFLTQALGNEPITIYGDGTQTLSFCYVEDMVRGLISLMNSKCEGPVNLGNPEEISIRTLAKLIRRKTASTSSLVYQTLPKDDPSHRRPCIRRARQELRWTPHVRLDEGLDRILTYLT